MGWRKVPMRMHSRQNIVLIISDYMGYRDTEPYGAEDVRTPSLARLASEGVTMTKLLRGGASVRAGSCCAVYRPVPGSHRL